MEGNSWRSSVVRLFQSEATDYSHVGVIVPSKNGWMVVHSAPEQDRCCLEQWDDIRASRDVLKVAVRRCHVLTVSQREAITAAAVQYASERVPFDHAFDGKDADKLYCTELVARAYAAAGCGAFLQACGQKPLFPNDLILIGSLSEVQTADDSE